MRCGPGVFFFSAFAFVFVFACAAAGAEQKEPLFECVGGGTCELGLIGPGEKQTARFRLKNVGSAPGVIRRLIPTCSCVHGASDKTWVQPQEDVEIQIGLDPAALQGTFRRVLWVDTSARKTARIPLTLSGTVRPLFDGAPEHAPHIVLPQGASWTNRLSLTPTDSTHTLGQAAIDTDTNALAASVTLTTNVCARKTVYTLTLDVTAKTSGHHSLVVVCPVEGPAPHLPVRLTYQFFVGLGLKLVPADARLSPTGDPQSFAFNLVTAIGNVVTANQSLDKRLLSWTPEREGVTVAVRSPPHLAHLEIGVTLSPEAVSALLKEAEPNLTFRYPNLAPVALLFRKPE